MNYRGRLLHRRRAILALAVCLLMLGIGLMKPALRTHHFGPFYRSFGYCHGPTRHTTLDVSVRAPDLQPPELGRVGTAIALAAKPVCRRLLRAQALDLIAKLAPPGVIPHRKIGPSRADDPDLLA